MKLINVMLTEMAEEIDTKNVVKFIDAVIRDALENPQEIISYDEFEGYKGDIQFSLSNMVDFSGRTHNNYNKLYSKAVDMGFIDEDFDGAMISESGFDIWKKYLS